MTLVIAEIGVNHNGDIELAKKLINIAHKAKSDIVKFQTFIAENLASPDAQKANYQKLNTNKLENQRDMLQKLELNHNDHYELMENKTKLVIKKKGLFKISFKKLNKAINTKKIDFVRTKNN